MSRIPPASSRFSEDAAFWTPVLAPGERLLWWGTPAQGIRFRVEDALKIPFGLLFFGFSLIWSRAAWRTDADLLMKIWGLPFVAVGFYLVVGRFLWDAYLRKHTRYALTESRALIAVSKGRRQFFSIPIALATEVDILPGPLTTILFDTPALPSTVIRHPRLDSFRGRGFEFIEDGEAVYRQIIEIQQRLRQERGRA